MVAMSFNASQFQPSTGGMDVFETGMYPFQINRSYTEETAKKDGLMLCFDAVCIEEGNAGKVQKIRLNVQNPNAQTVEIAMRELSAISHVTGVMEWTDTQQLHGKPFCMRLEKTTYTNKKGEEKPTNEILGYCDMNGGAPGEATAAGAGGGAPVAPTAPAATQPAPAPAQPATAPAPEQPATQPAPVAPVAQEAPAPATAPASTVAAPPWPQQ